MVYRPPTHLFLVNVLPGEDLPTKPALPGMPDPRHVVNVHAWYLDYVDGPEYLEYEIGALADVVPTLHARAAMERRRLSPWTQAKRAVVAALEDLYTTPDWSITWATTRQAHSGRGRWREHTTVLDHLADWSRDRALEFTEGTLSKWDLPEGEVAHNLDSALAVNGGDARNWVGLGAFKDSGSRLPDISTRPAWDLSDYGARWLTWN